MLNIINQTSATLQLLVRRDSGETYETTIPQGGSWGVPSDVQVVDFKA